MEKQEILKRLDHTLLPADSCLGAIKVLCDEGMEYGTASVCIPPSFVKERKSMWETDWLSARLSAFQTAI